MDKTTVDEAIIQHIKTGNYSEVRGSEKNQVKHDKKDSLFGESFFVMQT